ncbi:collagenase [Ferrimonas balearica]|uniref:collagenase n=1 Tax=Ferrimonas balearica TaxID=44012 RepID=UPI001C99AA34|nr:collagenase [Ferrimonas balearica]MBY5994191.1 collagenase [Ferrimonas balearica]
MRLLPLLVLTALMVACSSVAPPPPLTLNDWRTPDPQQLPLALAHLQRGDTEQALDYLRAYSYFGDPEQLGSAQRAQLHRGMLALGNTLDPHVTPRLAEQWAVTLYRYYGEANLAEHYAELQPALVRQLNAFTQRAPANLAQEYALWELLRAPGLLMHTARRQGEASALRPALTQPALTQTLMTFAASTQARYDAQDWPLKNLYWVLAHQRLLLDDEAGQAQDSQVAAIARQDAITRADAAGEAFTLGYLVNAFLGQEACTRDYPDLCTVPAPEAVLPILHRCSARLVIRAQDLAEAELADSCARLTAQEDHFHQLLATDRTPVANDHNHNLEVVVFRNWSQYNAYGQLLFDIGTDNGGMYIEGTPQAEGNQARFFAFRGWWLPEFTVWNLNHEYVHYLDGRYVKYGGFGHFPAQMVWWAEGLAEYIAKGAENRQALELLQTTPAEKRPSLTRVFATEYADGLERTYRWSYLAVRYLAETDPASLQAIAKPLKRDHNQGYLEALASTAEQHQAGFARWLDALAAEPLPEEEAASPYPRKLDRYSYRDYLRPSQLANTEGHLHF